MPDSLRSVRLARDFSKSSAVRQSGFIAQEVEVAAQESGYDFNGLHTPQSETDNYSLAYSQFVVPLVKSVQELSKQNEELKKGMEQQRQANESLKKEIDELRSVITNASAVKRTGSIVISGENKAELFQNAPNPFTQSTIIRYFIPSTVKKATLTINSMDGKKIAEYNLVIKSGQPVEISAGKLSPGTFVYSLYVDDKLIDSKKMVLTR